MEAERVAAAIAQAAAVAAQGTATAAAGAAATAQSTADSTGTSAATANAAATTAQTTANLGVTNAAAAQAASNAAESDAQTGIANAATASASAATAQATANGAQGTATAAATAAATAQSTADSASTSAETANTAAATAQTTANLGVTNAAAAQAAANAALANAVTAQTQANLGVANAASAQSTASSALSNAAAAQTTANAAIPMAQKGAPNGVASLDANGLLPTGELPPVAIDTTYVVTSQASQLALPADIGDVAIRSDTNESFILQHEPAITLTNWQMILTPAAPVQSVNGHIGVVNLGFSDLTNTLACNQLPAFLGDVANSGCGIALATVNTTVGAYGSSTAIPTVTADGKGRVTSITTSPVVAPAATLTGTALPAAITSAPGLISGLAANCIPLAGSSGTIPGCAHLSDANGIITPSEPVALLTGSTGATQAAGDSSAAIATDAFVQAASCSGYACPNHDQYHAPFTSTAWLTLLTAINAYPSAAVPVVTTATITGYPVPGCIAVRNEEICYTAITTTNVANDTFGGTIVRGVHSVGGLSYLSAGSGIYGVVTSFSACAMCNMSLHIANYGGMYEGPPNSSWSAGLMLQDQLLLSNGLRSWGLIYTTSANIQTGEYFVLPNNTTLASPSAGVVNVGVNGDASGTLQATHGIFSGSLSAATGSTVNSSAIVNLSDTQTLTNKTVDGVSPATMSYEDATSSIQNQLNSKQASLGFAPLNPANNLSDVSSASTARTNLGLGSAAQQSTSAFDVSGAAAAKAAPGTCTSGQYGTATTASGLTCAQVAYSQVSGTPTLGSAAYQNTSAFDAANTAQNALNMAETFSANANNLSSGMVAASLIPQLNQSTTGSSRFLSTLPDTDRNPNTNLPTSHQQSIDFEFVEAGAAGGGGNYSGLMTVTPWFGTTASTGDASYQMSFNSQSHNAGGIPFINLRSGIDSTWNSWYTLLNSGNYSTWALPNTGGAVTGPITLPADPTVALQAATKQYVDAHTSSSQSCTTVDWAGAPLTLTVLYGQPCVTTGTSGVGGVDLNYWGVDSHQNIWLIDATDGQPLSETASGNPGVYPVFSGTRCMEQDVYGTNISVYVQGAAVFCNNSNLAGYWGINPTNGMLLGFDGIDSNAYVQFDPRTGAAVFASGYFQIDGLGNVTSGDGITFNLTGGTQMFLNGGDISFGGGSVDMGGGPIHNLPDGVAPTDPVTVEQLNNHSSGISGLGAGCIPLAGSAQKLTGCSHLQDGTTYILNSVGFTEYSLGLANNYTNYGSFAYGFLGSYFNGTQDALDTWSAQSVLSSGANPTSTLTFTHTGSTGAAVVAVPALTVGGSSACTAATGCSVVSGPNSTITAITGLQLALPVAEGGTGVINAHGNGSAVQMSDGSGTPGDYAAFDANGNITESGIAAVIANFSPTSKIYNTNYLSQYPFHRAIYVTATDQAACTIHLELISTTSSGPWMIGPSASIVSGGGYNATTTLSAIIPPNWYYRVVTGEYFPGVGYVAGKDGGGACALVQWAEEDF